jgi:hypothetical protein
LLLTEVLGCRRRITFEDIDGKTRVGWRQVFNTAAECQGVAQFAIEASKQNLDRLAIQVAQVA